MGPAPVPKARGPGPGPGGPGPGTGHGPRGPRPLLCHRSVLLQSKLIEGSMIFAIWQVAICSRHLGTNGGARGARTKPRVLCATKGPLCTMKGSLCATKGARDPGGPPCCRLFSLNSWYSLGFYISFLGPVGASPDPESVARGLPWWSPTLWSPVVPGRWVLPWIPNP